MKLLTVFIFAGSMALSASTYSQRTKIDLNFENSSLTEILTSIEKTSEFIFIYNQKVVNADLKRTIIVKDENIEKVLSLLFEGADISFRIDDRQVFLYKKDELKNPEQINQGNNIGQQPKREISGAVKDVKGMTLPGVSVVVKGTTIGTVTDNDGKFQFSIPVDAKILVFSFIGMKTQEILIAGITTLNIVLREETVQLSEMVAVGYGMTTTREKMTGSIASVKGDKLSDRTTTSPLMLLDGLATGVRISSTTSLPGVTPDIRVREVSSWNAGVGVLFVIDGVVRDIDAFQSLNPNDIASVSVLKDAASAAIYGMKAGEGVLLVTTKNGESGKTKIEFGYSYAVSTPYMQYDKLNAYDFALAENRWNKLVGRPLDDARYFAPYEIEYFKTHSYSAFDEFWSNPISKNYNLSASGGNDKVKYFISGSLNTSDQSSFEIKYEKYTVRAKIDAKITNRLNFNLNLTSTWDKNMRPTYRNADEVGEIEYDWTVDGFGISPFGKLVMQIPTTPYYKIIDGVTYPLNINVAQIMLGQGGSSTFNNARINPVASLRYRIPGIEGLNASVQFAYNNIFSKNKLWRISPYTYNFIMDRHIVTDNFNYAGASGWRTKAVMTNQTTSGLSQTYGSDQGYQGNYQLEYTRSFGLHNVSGFAGYEFRGRSGDYIRATRYGYALESYNQISGGSTDVLNQKTAGDISSQDGMASWIGRLDYNFNSKYILGATIRRDGSYKFSPDKRWGTFPAVSAAWVASKEPFFEPLKSLFSFFKIRASWGVTGTDNTDAWQWQDTYSGGTSVADGTDIYNKLTTSVVPNPFITWEKNNNYNLGVDLGLFNDALTFTAEGWYKRTTDILGARVASTPGVVGAKLPDVNYGIASAQGVEFSANYQKKIGKLLFSIGGNIAHSVNKMILQDVAAGIRDYDNPNGQPMNRLRVREVLINETGNGVIRTQMEASTLMAENAVGSTPYTMGSEKIQIQPGTIYVRDFRGSNNGLFANSPDGNSNHIGTDDMVYIPGKYKTPRLVYGLNANIQWKGLELKMVAAGTGNYWRPMARGLTSFFEQFPQFFPDEWTPTNINSTSPSPVYAIHANWAGGRIDYPNTFFTYNMSFLRMKNVSLAYTIPAAMTKKAGIQGLKFYVNMENPFIIFKKCPDYMDPESNESVGYPILRSSSFGVNLAF